MNRESLWDYMRRDHPLVARAILTAHRQGFDTVSSQSFGASRRFVWECIKRHLPSTAALLTDPEFLALRDAFGGTVELESRVICRALAIERRAHSDRFRAASGRDPK